jgi:hypothetical protein
MSCLFRVLLVAALIAGAVLPETGCNGDTDMIPNPAMGDPPPIPPGRTGGEVVKPKAVKRQR